MQPAMVASIEVLVPLRLKQETPAMHWRADLDQALSEEQSARKCPGRDAGCGASIFEPRLARPIEVEIAIAVFALR